MSSNGFTLLAVDLDDTLLQTDLVWEALTELVRRKPHLLPLVPFVLLRGRAQLKWWLDRHIQLNIAEMPINESVLDFARACKAEGKTVILATAAIDSWAAEAAKLTGCFDAVIATNTVNCSGKVKLEQIQRLSNGQPFAYIGDHGVDIPLWQAAKAAYIVGDPQRYERRIGKSFAGAFPKQRATWRDWFNQLRIAQWSKNVLVFVPLLLAHQSINSSTFLRAAGAAFFLSLIASALYVLNDLLDLPSDRAHPIKRNRPLARGIISLQTAWLTTAVLLVLGFGGAAVALPFPVFGLITGYAIASAAYSIALKHIPIVDILMLGGLYTLRLLIGGVATETEISSWLLGFALMFFTSLALLKRHSEAVTLRLHNQNHVYRHPYTEQDEQFFFTTGVATAALSVVILILYLTSHRVQQLYTHPERLWAVLPIVLFWTLRMWRLSLHGKLASDPVSFAIRDPISLGIAIAIALLVLFIAR